MIEEVFKVIYRESKKPVDIGDTILIFDKKNAPVRAIVVNVIGDELIARTLDGKQYKLDRKYLDD